MFWFLFIFIYFLISPAAGTLSLSFSSNNNDNNNPTPTSVLVGTITTLSWARESQDPLSFFITTVPNVVLQNGPVRVDSGGQSTGQVDLVFQQAGSFSIQAIDVNDPTNLLQETPTFTVQSVSTSAARIFDDPIAITAPQQASPIQTTDTPSSSSPTTTTTASPSPPSSTSSSSTSASDTTSAKSRVAVIATVCSVLIVVLIILIIVIVMMIRRRRALKRHTFTPEMMMRGGGGPPVLGVTFPSETDLERGSSNNSYHNQQRAYHGAATMGLAMSDEIDIFSPSKDAVAFSSKPVLSPPHLSANANWLSRPPTRSELATKRTSGSGGGRIRALPSPPTHVDTFIGGRSPRELPRPGMGMQIQTARDFYYPNKEEEPEEYGAGSPVSAKTSVSTAELRGKMVNGLEKVRKARRSQYYG